MCSLLAYCLDENAGEVQAAFEYNDISLAEMAVVLVDQYLEWN